MMDLLILIVITSIALYGSKVTWQEGMIFEKPKLWLDKHFAGNWIIDDYSGRQVGKFDQHTTGKTRIGRFYSFRKYLSKPLYACPACMASIWGSIIYIANVGPTFHVELLILFDLAVCGLTWILMWQFPFDD